MQYASAEKYDVAYKSFSSDEGVEYVIPDSAVKASALENRTGALTQQSDKYKRYLRENGKTAKTVVAVIDTGVDSSHAFLRERMLGGYNFVDNNTNTSDIHGHGTHVSGIIADNTPESTKIMPIKALADDGSGTDLGIALAIDYAVKKGADVISMSLGGLCGEDSCPIAVSVNKAVAAGVTVVVAAGNDNSDTAAYCPAHIESCITVAAYNTSADSVSSYSNFGAAVDLCAPGDNILSCAPGGSYVSMTGTSMACPFAAAAAAMLLTNEPSLTPAQVEIKLRSTCADTLIRGTDKYSGSGIINFGILLGEKNELTYVHGDETLTLYYFSKCTSWYTHILNDREDNALPATDRSVSAVSSAPKVAIYDGKYIHPLSAGTAVITFTAKNGAKTSCTVTVKKTEVWIDYAAKTYAGGNGTEKSPYLISTPQQLAKFALDTRLSAATDGKHFKLTNDIDLAGKLWITASFASVVSNYMQTSCINKSLAIFFDGANKKIKNMNVFNENLKKAWYDGNPLNASWYYNNTGFIFILENGTVRNLGLENAYSADRLSGLLVTELMQDSTVANCWTSGFSGGSGLFYNVTNYGITISNCFSSARVLGSGIAEHVYSSMTDGGVNITNTFFCGEQLPSSTADEVSGFARNITSYENYSYTKLTNCFSASTTVTGLGFAAKNEYSVIKNCYYSNMNSVGVKKTIKAGSDVSARSPEFFKKKSNFIDASFWDSAYKWDFDKVWAITPGINNGYPYLRSSPPGKTVMAATGTWFDSAAASFAGGSGTKASPYLISNAPQLARLSYLYRFGGGEGTYFELTADIDLSGREWMPVGCGQFIDSLSTDKFSKEPFMGNIDGAGKTIKGLTVNTHGDYAGFIALGNSCTVKNLSFTGAIVSGNNGAGVIFGKADILTAVYGCTAQGSVSASNNAGGICGESSCPVIITGCESKCSVSASGDYTGGIAGYSFADITACCYTGNNVSTVGVCSGGISGTAIGGSITDSYSLIFPLCGFINSCEIKNCYAAAKKSEIFGELCREGVSVAASELTKAATFTGWNFNTTWSMTNGVNGGMPILKPVTVYPQPPWNEPLPNENWSDYAVNSFCGEGTEESPYLISTAEELAGIILASQSGRYSTTEVHIRLIRDIDLAGKLWGSKFMGLLTFVRMVFEGNNKTIKNLTMKNGDGLFPLGLLGRISNLNLSGVKGSASCALIAAVYSGTVTGCSVRGSLFTAQYMCDNNRSVADSGGIASQNFGEISRCSVDMQLTGTENTGGITGYNTGTISDCVTYGDFSGRSKDYFFGNNMGTVSHSFSLAHVFLKNNGIRYDSDNTCVSLSDLSQLRKKSNFSGWNFTNIWGIDRSMNNGFPYLKKTESKKITYFLNGGTASAHTEYDYIPGNTVILQPANKNGMVFTGWYTDAALTKRITCIPFSYSGDITLYAKWGSLIKGDVDLDGVVTSGDARLALRTAVKLEPDIIPGTIAYKAADVDGTKGVSASDARLILRASVKLEKLR